MKCKFYDSQIKCCTNKHNKDIRSKKQNGHLRRMHKRCEKLFCPLGEEEWIKMMKS